MLVVAFRATLEEVVEANVILHVHDISHEDAQAQAEDVESVLFFFASRRRHTICYRDGSSDVCSSDLMIPLGTDALSPAPQHDIYSIEDLRQLIYALKEATNYEKPISVKIAAVHNAAAIASGIVRAGADIVAIDGVRGSTGAAPK